MSWPRKLQACAATVPDRAVLILGLCVTGVVCLSAQDGQTSRRCAALAENIPRLTEQARERLREYAQSARRVREEEVAASDLPGLIASMLAAEQVEAGVELIRLSGSFGDRLPDPQSGDSIQLNYTGPRGWVANSIIVVGDKAWLARWSLPAQSEPHSAAMPLGGAGIALSFLLFWAKRTWAPWQRQEPGR
jgi:hypothetical protein